MMPVVRIPDPIYKRLQAIAVPFEDTPLTVIEKLLDEYEARQQSQQYSPAQKSGENTNYIEEDISTVIDEENYITLDPNNPSNLCHSRVLRALIEGQEIKKPNWNRIVAKLHEIALQRGVSVKDLVKLTRLSIFQGEKNQDGFHYLPEINISIQGVNANLAWRSTLCLVKHLKLPIEIYFEWRDKEGAAHPGEKGKLFWNPK